MVFDGKENHAHHVPQSQFPGKDRPVPFEDAGPDGGRAEKRENKGGRSMRIAAYCRVSTDKEDQLNSLEAQKKFFEELIKTGNIKEIVPSDVWYEERTDWSKSAVGTERTKHENEGFQLLQGKPVFAGKILGGCLESIYDIFDNSRYPDTISLCEKYDLFPSLEDWKGKILLLETSEEQPDPKHYRKMVETLKKVGVFDVVSGVICGKPMNELYFDEYKKIIVDVIDNPNISVVANINIGHATPRCIIPFGIEAEVDAVNQKIRFV